MPVRLATRKIWVSTAIVGWPNAVFRMTFAVFLPTPGRLSSASRVRGTSPLKCCTSSAQVAITFFALVRNRPMRWM
jgi:hypothetical protein